MRERTKHRRTSAHFTIDIQNPGRYWAKPVAHSNRVTQPTQNRRVPQDRLSLVAVNKLGNASPTLLI
jgi:hypothetical protein